MQNFLYLRYSSCFDVLKLQFKNDKIENKFQKNFQILQNIYINLEFVKIVLNLTKLVLKTWHTYYTRVCTFV